MLENPLTFALFRIIHRNGHPSTRGHMWQLTSRHGPLAIAKEHGPFGLEEGDGAIASQQQQRQPPLPGRHPTARRHPHTSSGPTSGGAPGWAAPTPAGQALVLGRDRHCFREAP